MSLVKVCGVSDPAHAVVAAEAGADFIGIVFAPSPRQVAIERARQIVQAVRAPGGLQPKLVGVFVNAPPDEVNATVAELGLDMAQLSGDEDASYLEQMWFPVIKAVHVAPGEPGKAATLALRRRLARLRSADAVPLLDTKARGKRGGTGQTFDWRVAQELAQDFEFLLAGGLTPENIARAVALVRPWAVDVSSGVETGGAKDPQKIRAFIRQAREASE